MAEPAGRALPWAFVAGLVAMAVNLRGPFVAVAPVADQVRDDLGLGSGAIGLLTTIPVACFALAAPLALVVVRRAGAEVATTLCLGGVVVGSLVRSSGPFWVAVAGSVLLGVAITIGNVVSPVLIRRWVPREQVGLVTGIWVSALNVGSMLVTVATDPLAGAVGWRGALLAWGLLAAVGLVAWEVLRRRFALAARTPDAGEPRSGGRSGGGSEGGSGPGGGDRPAPGAEPERPDFRVLDLRGWLLMLAFACQAASYYGVTAWLPQVLGERSGLSSGTAGGVAAVFQIFAVVGALGVPLLARRRGAWVGFALVGVLWAVLPLQLLLVPEAYLVGAVLSGAAQGGGLSAVLAAVARIAHTDADSARLSAAVQGVGYAAGALWPFLLGVVHDATGTWILPLWLVLATTTVFLLLGLAFSHLDHQADRRRAVGAAT